MANLVIGTRSLRRCKRCCCCVFASCSIVLFEEGYGLPEVTSYFIEVHPLLDLPGEVRVEDPPPPVAGGNAGSQILSEAPLKSLKVVRRSPTKAPKAVIPPPEYFASVAQTLPVPLPRGTPRWGGTSTRRWACSGRCRQTVPVGSRSGPASGAGSTAPRCSPCLDVGVWYY